jgi:hypothetical protein
MCRAKKAPPIVGGDSGGTRRGLTFPFANCWIMGDKSSQRTKLQTVEILLIQIKRQRQVRFVEIFLDQMCRWGKKNLAGVPLQ